MGAALRGAQPTEALPALAPAAGRRRRRAAVALVAVFLPTVATVREWVYPRVSVLA